jgi:eukaryotic translation initiation factor 2C
MKVGSGALLPLEICEVPAGQIMRKQVPPELTKSVLDFATKQPAERLKSINNGLSVSEQLESRQRYLTMCQVLAYGQSEYLRQFGLEVTSNTALKIKSRVLPPPILRFGQGSRQATVVSAISSACPRPH